MVNRGREGFPRLDLHRCRWGFVPELRIMARMMVSSRFSSFWLAVAIALLGPSALAQSVAQPTTPIAAGSGTGSHAPVWEESQSDYTTSTKEKVTITLRATDEDADPLTYNVSGLPLNAKAEPGEGSVLVTWTPQESDVGVYHVVATVTDGAHKVPREIKIVVEDEHESFFMPGVGFSMFVPNSPEKLGIFVGARVEILPAAWIHLNEKRGPSHGRVYLAFDILTSTKRGPADLPYKGDVHDALIPTIGFDLSLERNPARRWLVPFFGLEGGAFFQLNTGTVACLEPLGGVHLFATQNVYLNLVGGYFLPLSSELFDDVRGVRGRLTFDFSLW